MKAITTASIALLVSVALFFPKNVSADPKYVVFSDNFDQGNLDKWQPTRDDGQMWKIVDGAVEVNVTSRSTITELVPKDEFWSSDWKNIIFSYDLTPLQGADKNTSFGWESLRRWFEVHFVGNILNLVRVNDGSTPLNIFEPFKMINNRTYHIEIRIIDQTISVTVNGKLVSEVVDATYLNNGGKIGLKAGTGSVYPTRMRYDNIFVEIIPTIDTNLDVPIFKQTNPLWGDEQYDQADLWSSNPTIGRWGCLVSSISMVMNYHGLDKMPDGTELNPASLNAWLISEADGYVGDGLLNWIAASRLTRILSEKYGTPKLEYARLAGTGLQTTLDQIDLGQPTILEIAGHFLVGTGFSEDKLDLLINDPSYAYDRFSQHQSELISTRTLTPSFTDLSYLMLVHNPELEIKVTDEAGNPVVGWEKFTEQLTDHVDGSGEVQPAMVVEQLAKPSQTTYTISISQPQLGPYQLSIMTYDTEANPTILKETGLVGKQSIEFEIEYFPDKPSVITKKVNYCTY